MGNELKPLRRHNLVWREVDGEVVILTSDNKFMHVLDDVGSRIWALLDGEHSVKDIKTTISTEYEDTGDTLEKDLAEYLEKLRKLNLLQE